MKFAASIAGRSLHVSAVFPVQNADLLIGRIADRRNHDAQDLRDALYAQVKAKLPKGATLREFHYYADYLFVIEYDLPAARVAYMEYRILVAVGKACKAFWGIHKIGKTPEYRAQWRKENP